MNKSLNKLSRQYVAVLKKYLTDGHEAVLAEAYELGRNGIADGLGVLDMGCVHAKAVDHLLRLEPPLSRNEQTLNRTETFFLESLSPFEATHRGFRETTQKLRQLNATLEKRNADLAKTNRLLAAEIRERERAEASLRQLFDEARAMQENLRNLSNKVLHVQEEERKRISRELHDEVGQAMTAISINIGALEQIAAGTGEKSREKIADTQALLQQTMETVHRFARELRPAMLDELGLLSALRSYLKHFANRTGLRVRFRGNPIAEQFGVDQKIVLFRVAQESLTNVAKHARASQVEVAVCKFKDGICMTITDDGKSFKENSDYSKNSNKRLGLLGMKERLRLVNGRLAIRTQPGKATTVRAEIPFNFQNAPKSPTVDIARRGKKRDAPNGNKK
jgi:signal transduction histidine kinase